MSTHLPPIPPIFSELEENGTRWLMFQGAKIRPLASGDRGLSREVTLEVKQAEKWNSWAAGEMLETGFSSYDEDAARLGFKAPRELMEAIADRITSDMSVLDLGCGSGRLRKELSSLQSPQAGACRMFGVDISAEQLAAIPVGFYTKTFCASLCQQEPSLLLGLGRYDALISAGVFGDYVNPARLRPYVSVLNPGALIAITGRKRVQSLESKLKKALKLKVERAWESPAYTEANGKPVLYEFVVGTAQQ